MFWVLKFEDEMNTFLLLTVIIAGLIYYYHSEMGEYQKSKKLLVLLFSFEFKRRLSSNAESLPSLERNAARLKALCLEKRHDGS